MKPTIIVSDGEGDVKRWLPRVWLGDDECKMLTVFHIFIIQNRQWYDNGRVVGGQSVIARIDLKVCVW